MLSVSGFYKSSATKRRAVVAICRIGIYMHSLVVGVPDTREYVNIYSRRRAYLVYTDTHQAIFSVYIDEEIRRFYITQLAYRLFSFISSLSEQTAGWDRSALVQSNI